MTQPIDRFVGPYAFLSNFWPHSQYGPDGETYPTAEHAFQAQKSMNMEDRKRIAAAATPGSAKALGRRVKLRDDWEDAKLGIMEGIVREKFQDPTLQKLLLTTGDAPLQEGNHWNDTFWGVCRGRGQNKLGVILMDVRATLEEEAQ